MANGELPLVADDGIRSVARGHSLRAPQAGVALAPARNGNVHLVDNQTCRPQGGGWGLGGANWRSREAQGFWPRAQRAS
jgi:hypothetical protein